MSKRRKALAAVGDGSFTRGCVAAGCLSAFQDRARPSARRVLRHALQGGAALTAGTQAAASLREGRIVGALAAVAAGAAAVYLIENLLGETSGTEENRAHGQKS
ncbi:hypothetical protein CLD22_03205 [Rubrivivax gelatinosus]|nr:hypothetical protein [Rubrivivax gelatinosus]